MALYDKMIMNDKCGRLHCVRVMIYHRLEGTKENNESPPVVSCGLGFKSWVDQTQNRNTDMC
jgi:hypothetical protein